MHDLRKNTSHKQKNNSTRWEAFDKFEQSFHKIIQQIKKDLRAQENETVCLLLDRIFFVHLQVSDRGVQMFLEGTRNLIYTSFQ